MKVIYNDIIDDGYEEKVAFDEVEKCPICKHAIKPSKIYGEIVRDGVRSPKLALLYFCTHCNDVFIAQYSNRAPNKEREALVYTKLDFVAPNKFEETKFEQCINELSPMFVKIYNQALQAESENLDEIAGIGYRKALEFLTKDFLIKQFPDKEESIKNTRLGTCIENFIENPQLKTVASRAVWLGNDQTHYVQKFEDKDIEDLKRLIKLAINWITMLYLTNEAEQIEKP